MLGANAGCLTLTTLCIITASALSAIYVCHFQRGWVATVFNWFFALIVLGALFITATVDPGILPRTPRGKPTPRPLRGEHKEVSFCNSRKHQSLLLSLLYSLKRWHYFTSFGVFNNERLLSLKPHVLPLVLSSPLHLHLPLFPTQGWWRSFTFLRRVQLLPPAALEALQVLRQLLHGVWSSYVTCSVSYPTVPHCLLFSH